MREVIGNRIIGFGDSITAGSCVEPNENWMSLLGNYLAGNPEYSNVEVSNCGVGGNTSREGLDRFTADVKPLLPGLVIIEFGGNDATSDLKRNVSIEEFDRNIRSIVRKVRNGAGEPVLMTFPPILEDKHSTINNPFYEPYGGCDGLVEVYRDITRLLAKELGCRLIDLDIELRNVMSEKGESAIILEDGVHLTIQGNQEAMEIVVQALELE